MPSVTPPGCLGRGPSSCSVFCSGMVRHRPPAQSLGLVPVVCLRDSGTLWEGCCDRSFTCTGTQVCVVCVCVCVCSVGCVVLVFGVCVVGGGGVCACVCVECMCVCVCVCVCEMLAVS